MKKFLKFALAVVIGVPVLLLVYLLYSTEANRATPAEAALAALQPTALVSVEEHDGWLIMKPTGTTPTAGMILYPGANCDIHGYAELLRATAAAGYLAVGVSMPFDFAIFAPDSADDVRAAYPEIRNWVIAGHSMGGAMAGRYAFYHQDDLAGLIMYDSYPPEAQSLADTKLPVAHIFRATLAGEPPQKFTDMAHVYPPTMMKFPVPGGIHMYFGSFIGGGYKEQWTPKISNAAQIEIASAATLSALQKME